MAHSQLAGEKNILVDPMDLPDTNIVVSGIAGRFAEASSLNELQHYLHEGIDMVTENNNRRWPDGLYSLPSRAGRIKDISSFDAEFFGYTDEEANVTDHQLRVLYEVVYESIIESGVNPASLRNTKTGLFLGLHTAEFENELSESDTSKSRCSGYSNQMAILLAQYFDLRGEVSTFDLACASGFGAFHQATLSLREGLIDQAIVCAVNISLNPQKAVLFLGLQMLSPTGRCMFLDKDANGYAKCEACVSVFLQKKQLALRNYCSIMSTNGNCDGSKVEGITFPSAEAQETLIRDNKIMANVHSDHVEYIEAHGTGTPVGDPQEAKALTNVYYPKEGDPLRFNERTIGPLLVGSSKTNMGHSEGASGLCALARVILMFENEIIYKSLHYNEPNPNIESLFDGRMKLVVENQKLNSKIIPMSCYGFGGGNINGIFRANNRDVIKRPSGQDGDKFHIIEQHRLVLMFGRTEENVLSFFDNIMSDECRRSKTLTRDFLALVDSLCSGPIDRLMKYRGVLLVDMENETELYRSVVACNMSKPLGKKKDDLKESKLETTKKNNSTKFSVTQKSTKKIISDQEDNSGEKLAQLALKECKTHRAESPLEADEKIAHLQDYKPKPCYFVYPGLGCEWLGMASDLKNLDIFWSTIERLHDILKAVDYNLIELLSTTLQSNEIEAHHLTVKQSAIDLFVGVTAIQIALTNILTKKLNIQPTGGVIGHSFGEIACAYADGLYDERETILTAYYLSKTLEDNAAHIDGSMFVFNRGFDDMQKLLYDYLSVQSEHTIGSTLYISCVNGPESVTISGAKRHMMDFASYISETDATILKSELNIDFAGHNPYIMDCTIQKRLSDRLRKLLHPGTNYSTSDSRWLSTVRRGTKENDENENEFTANFEYYAVNLCSRVEFSKAINRIEAKNEDCVIIEIGPSGIFESIVKTASLAMSKTNNNKNIDYIKLMKKNDSDSKLTLFASLGKIFQAGVEVDLARGDLYPKIEAFPVRRQCPSISSLMKWDHNKTYFVPRCPLQFNKSSANTTIAVDIMLETDKFLTGHKVGGRVLFPSAGYIYHMWRVFSFSKTSAVYSFFQEIEYFVPAEFLNVRLFRAILLSSNNPIHLHIRLDTATGRFEFKESGSVVCDGIVRTPKYNKDGQLYDHIGDRIKNENLEQSLNHDDIYKILRLGGYDYGETFQGIQSSSNDGRHLKVKFNGDLISLLDSMLQSLIVTLGYNFVTDGLVLPVAFDYIRINSNILFKKIKESGAKVNKSNLWAIMQAQRREEEEHVKILERQRLKDKKEQSSEQSGREAQEENKEEEEKVCIFDVYSDKDTGTLVTDGFEVRQVTPSVAPRRELIEPTLEAYKFVADIEEIVEDLELSRNASKVQYDRVCASAIARLFSTETLDLKKRPIDLNVNDSDRRGKLSSCYESIHKLIEVNSLLERKSLLNNLELDKYMNEYLTIRREHLNRTTIDQKENEKASSKETDDNKEVAITKKNKDQLETYIYNELSKNKEFSLLSALDSIWTSYCCSSNNNSDLPIIEESSNGQVLLKETPSDSDGDLLLATTLALEEHKDFLKSDLMISGLFSERFLRPAIETIVENICQVGNVLSLVEFNTGNYVGHDVFSYHVNCAKPNIKLDYSLVHPEPSSLKNIDSNSIRTYTLHLTSTEDDSSKTQNDGDKNEQKRLPLKQSVNGGNPVDSICYYDDTCYIAQKDVEDFTDIEFMLSTMCELIKENGYLIIMARRQVSVAERFLMAMKKLNKLQHDEKSEQHQREYLHHGEVPEEANHIQMTCEARCNLLESLMSNNNNNESYKMIMLSKRMDATGCIVYLFKKKNSNLQLDNDSEPNSACTDCDNYSIVHVTHGDYIFWLNKLKEEFGISTQLVVSNDSTVTPLTIQTKNNIENKINESPQPGTTVKTVWLCAVSTSDNPVSGIVGMVQCLLKELSGKTNPIRCFYDSYTFKTRKQCSVSSDDINKSENFQLALKRDILWNCVDSNGIWGSFRHFKLDQYLNAPKTACMGESNLVYLPDTIGSYANIANKGDLSSFKWYQAPHTYFDDDDDKQQNKIIRIHYSALNFKDIMVATGLIPIEALVFDLDSHDCYLGFEFSGYDPTRNKRVMGLTQSMAMATQLVCLKDDSFIYDIPDDMTMEEAATIPVVYTTALMALIQRGRMQAGETILIHAGAGGIGQAAIRLAIHYKVKIFTTVGSEEKRQFLLKEFPGSLTSDRIFYSRDCSFERDLMRATNGRGVDLVLNSLADDKLQASIRCLTTNGRFLEIGKKDSVLNRHFDLTQLDVNKTFEGIHLDRYLARKLLTPYGRKQLESIGNLLKKGLEEGFIRPIKFTSFPRDKISDAFRYMAKGRHIGKVLIEIQPEKDNLIELPNGVNNSGCLNKTTPAIPTFELDPRQAYIVTGGLGGFGLELVKWMRSVGARNFILTGRKGAVTGYQKLALEKLRRDCNILVCNNNDIDGTTLEGVRKLFQLAKELSPKKTIGGVFHLAMVLKDAMLENLTGEDFEIVCKPKADACILLDKVSRELQTHSSMLFVVFSSITSGKGNAGQANYAYANSLMERICEQRRQDNLHGMAIQWGPIGDVGAAYETLGGNDVVLLNGIIPQRIPSCFDTMKKLLCSPFAVCLSLIQQKHGGSCRTSLVETIFHVLGITDPSKVGEDATLGELGLDSLMVVEIHQYIEREYDMTLTNQQIRALTIGKIREIERQETLKGKKLNKSDLANNKEALKHYEELKKSGEKFNFAASYDPQLELPKSDFLFLNSFSVDSTNKTLNETTIDRQQCISPALAKRPIFLLANVFGQFESLKLIGEKLDRPCVGLTWTNKLNKANNFTLAAEYYVDLLERFDYTSLSLNDDNNTLSHSNRIVDLIGYSFGATLAFEIFYIIQQRKRQQQVDNNGRTTLIPGQLILLDMSPKISEKISSLSGSGKFIDKVSSEILGTYILHHAKESKLDIATLRNDLYSIKGGLEARFDFTCKTLAKLLNITEKSKQDDLLDAIVAYYRRGEVTHSYNTDRIYKGDATLIRTKVSTIIESCEVTKAEDYLLSQSIDGRINLHTFEGDHETFIGKNLHPICSLINDLVMSDAQTSPQ